MAELDEKLGSILNNPQMMQQIMSMAQSLGQPSSPTNPPSPKEQSIPTIDPALMQKLAGMAASSGTDQQQRALLNALGPYLNRDKVQRLEKAMRAARLARMASSFLGSGALQALTGR